MFRDACYILFLRSVDPVSLYNLVNKTNLVHNLFLVFYYSVHVSGDCACHQEKQLCFCDTWYFYVLLFCMHTKQPSTQNNKCQVSHKHSCFSWWWAHSHPKHVEIDKYSKNKLCTQLVLFTQCSYSYSVLCTIDPYILFSNYHIVPCLHCHLSIVPNSLCAKSGNPVLVYCGLCWCTVFCVGVMCFVLV
jgi:hypothetical protein